MNLPAAHPAPGHVSSPSVGSAYPNPYDTMDSLSSHSTPSSIPSDSAAGSDPPVDSSAGHRTYYNNVYYSYDSRPPSQVLPPHAISAIYYAPALLLSDGSLQLSDPDTDLHREMDGTHGCLSALLQLKQQNPALRVLLSIGARDFFRQVSTAERRQKFAFAARAFLDTHHLDGIDVDWQFPDNAREGANHESLMLALRQQLPRCEYLLTTAMPPAPSHPVYGDSGVRNIARTVDFVNLNAFDFAFNGGPAVHQAQLYAPRHSHGLRQLSVHVAVTEVRKCGIPARKILLGIPAYGRRFLETFGNEGLDTDRRPQARDKIPYRDLPLEGYSKVELDPNQGGSWSASENHGWISCDDPGSVGMKCDWIKLNKLGGLFIRDAIYDAPEEARSLVHAGFHNLNTQ